MKLEIEENDVIAIIVICVVLTLAVLILKGCDLYQNHEYRMRQSTNQVAG